MLLLASTVSAFPLELYKQLLRRDPPTGLPEKATAAQIKYQPVLDFDTDGCYNTPAISASGQIAEGLDHNWTGGSTNCRDLSDLDNNNVYVRSRCNNGWCAHLYDYYFEKDVAVQNFYDVGGHRHDWEHIVVFVQGETTKIVAASAHGNYDVKNAADVRFDGTHPKIVYHKDGGSTHAFRFGSAADDKIENHKGVWFRGPLIDYATGFPSIALRDSLVAHDFGSASIAFKDSGFQGNLDKARGSGGAPGFNSGIDG